jgi:hypothetical protein
LKGFLPTTATSTIRIRIPLANVFSVEAVTQLMHWVREGDIYDLPQSVD